MVNKRLRPLGEARKSVHGLDTMAAYNSAHGAQDNRPLLSHRARNAGPQQESAAMSAALSSVSQIGRRSKRSKRVTGSKAARPRTSDLIRGVLSQNPDTKVFTLETIMRSIGEDRFEANLLFVSLPTLPDKAAMTEVMIAGHIAAGAPTLALPPSLLKREIPRRALAAAIHAALPVIEAAEKLARPRLGWLTHPLSRRIIGAFLFVLAAAVAFPLVGFDPLQTLSTFAISLGLAEGDGAAILLGVVIGVLSLAVIVASTATVRALRSKASRWLRDAAKGLGTSLLGRLCERIGLGWIGRLLSFQWTDLLGMWDPEAGSRATPRPAAAKVRPPRRAKAAQAEARAVREHVPESIAA